MALFYWDDWGPIQKDGDDGDQLQRLGLYYTGLFIRDFFGLSNKEYANNTGGDYIKFLHLHEIQLGRYIRGKKWNDPNDVSRDQLIPNIIAMGLYGMTGRLRTLTDQSLIHGFCPNKDILFPQHYGMIERGFGGEAGAFQDACLYLDVLTNTAKSFNPDFCDDINLILLLIQSTLKWPTEYSRRACHFYASKRRPGLGSTQLRAGNPILGSFMWYFREDSGGSPGFVDMYEPIIQRCFYD